MSIISRFSSNIDPGTEPIHQRPAYRTGARFDSEPEDSDGAGGSFPSITVEGGKVDAKLHVAAGTRSVVIAGFVGGILGMTIAMVSSCGILLLALLIYWMSAWHIRKKATALIHGSGVHVGKEQFPEIHRCVTVLKERLDLRKDVEVYIVQAKVINAGALKFGRKNVVLLTDELIRGCLASGHPQALAFVIAHELAHMALNHTGAFRSWIARTSKKLARLDEYSADSVATALSGDKSIAFHGILLLTIGSALVPYVNLASIIRQAEEVAANKYTKKAEETQTHPLLLNRLQRILKA